MSACLQNVVSRLHPQRRTVYAGVLIFPPPAMEKVANFNDEWWNKAQSSSKGAVIYHLTRGPDGNVGCYRIKASSHTLLSSNSQPTFMASIFYNGSEDEGRAFWKPLFDIGT
jgi:hypothetical protein